MAERARHDRLNRETVSEAFTVRLHWQPQHLAGTK